MAVLVPKLNFNVGHFGWGVKVIVPIRIVYVGIEVARRSAYRG